MPGKPKPKAMPTNLTTKPKVKAKPKAQPGVAGVSGVAGVAGAKRKNSRSPSAGVKRKTAVRLEVFFSPAMHAMTAPTVVCSGRQLPDLKIVRGSPNKKHNTTTNNKTSKHKQNKQNKTPQKALKKSEISAGETVKRKCPQT